MNCKEETKKRNKSVKEIIAKNIKIRKEYIYQKTKGLLNE